MERRTARRTARALAAAVLILAASSGAGARAGGEPALAGWSERVPRAAGAPELFVAPEGKAENPGTREAPWDLASALAGRKEVQPGSVVWVRGGTYRGKFQVKIAGREGAPVFVRALPGERATVLDSGLEVVEPAAWVWIWGLEIAGSLPAEKRESRERGSSPGDLPLGGGLNVHAGRGCKLIDLYIHDNVGGGVGWWVGSTDSEIHGCVIHSNGWRAPDRGHGHCIYTQNRDGLKTMSGCILSVPHEGSYTMHAYGSSRAYVDGFLLEANIAYERGPFLVGGGRPSRGILVIGNCLHGVDLRIGYGAENEDCEVRGNVVARGKISIEKYRRVVKEGNEEGMPGMKAVLMAGRYDPLRAHLAVYNGAKAPQEAVRVAPFLRPGDGFRLLDPRDLWGKPVVEGRCAGEMITVPMNGEFGAFVILKGS